MKTENTPSLRIGAVGLGRLGKLHAFNLASGIRGAQLTAVCAVDEAELRRESPSLGSPEAFLDFKEMLEGMELDAVVLSSPSQFHCGQTVEALSRGLHVFCEKPLGTDLDDCRRVVEAVRQSPDQVFMLGFMRRHDPSYQHAKSLVDNGAVGKPVLFRGYSVDPESAIDGAIRYAGHSAGQFLDMAIHDFDLARWFLGGEVRSLWAVGGCFAHPEFAEFGDGDNVAALAQFENEAMAFFLAGRTAAHGYQVETELIGTKGSVRIGSAPSRDLVEVLGPDGVRQEFAQDFIERFSTAYRAELQAFVDAVSGLQTGSFSPGATALDGLQATRIALAATESFRSGKKIDLAH